MAQTLPMKWGVLAAKSMSANTERSPHLLTYPRYKATTDSVGFPLPIPRDGPSRDQQFLLPAQEKSRQCNSGATVDAIKPMKLMPETIMLANKKECSAEDAVGNGQNPCSNLCNEIHKTLATSHMRSQRRMRSAPGKEYYRCSGIWRCSVWCGEGGKRMFPWRRRANHPELRLVSGIISDERKRDLVSVAVTSHSLSSHQKRQRHGAVSRGMVH
jgi:hypothetical protein